MPGRPSPEASVGRSATAIETARVVGGTGPTAVALATGRGAAMPAVLVRDEHSRDAVQSGPDGRRVSVAPPALERPGEPGNTNAVAFTNDTVRGGRRERRRNGASVDTDAVDLHRYTLLENHV